MIRIKKRVYNNLYNYCIYYDLDYKKMKDRFIRMNKSCQYFNLSELEKYDLCKKRYLKKEKYKLLKTNFEILEENKMKSYKEICLKLNINYKRALQLSLDLNDKKKALLYIYYFSDYENINGINISKKRIDSIKDRSILNIKDNIYYNIAFYLSGHEEFLLNILNYFKSFFKFNIFKVLRTLNINMNKDIVDELLAESNFIFIKTLNNVVMNDIRCIIKYLKISLYYRVYDYVKKFYKKTLELDVNRVGSGNYNVEFYDF